MKKNETVELLVGAELAAKLPVLDLGALASAEKRILPDGEHDMTIRIARYETIKSGARQGTVVLSLALSAGEDSALVWKQLPLEAPAANDKAWFNLSTVAFCKALGVEFSALLAPASNALLGMDIRAVVDTVQSETYGPQNRVKTFVKASA